MLIIHKGTVYKPASWQTGGLMIIRQPPLSEPEVACSSGKRFLRARPAIPPTAGTKLAGLRKFLQEVLADYLFLPTDSWRMAIEPVMKEVLAD